MHTRTWVYATKLTYTQFSSIRWWWCIGGLGDRGGGRVGLGTSATACSTCFSSRPMGSHCSPLIAACFRPREKCNSHVNISMYWSKHMYWSLWWDHNKLTRMFISVYSYKQVNCSTSVQDRQKTNTGTSLHPRKFSCCKILFCLRFLPYPIKQAFTNISKQPL